MVLTTECGSSSRKYANGEASREGEFRAVEIET